MNTKTLLIAIVAGTLSAMTVVYAINKRENKRKNSTIENAGIPDQVDNKDLAQLQNSKMVSEGSQFGVQYYNELKAKRKQLK